MTTTIVLGAKRTEVKKYTDIKFIKLLTGDYRVEPIASNRLAAQPKEWKYIELITKNYGSGMDLMFAYDSNDERDEGHLFIGYWNDGVVGQ